MRNSFTPTFSSPGRRLLLGAVGLITTAALAAGGDLDPDFGAEGRVLSRFGGPEFASAVAIQTDGKIVAAGAFGADFALARFNPDGSRNLSFGVDGLVTTSFGGLAAAHALAIQADGKLVAAGTAFRRGRPRLAVARYLPDGRLDPSFGVVGRATVDGGGRGGAFAMAIQPDGGIVLAGGVGRFTLARFTMDGRLDVTFGKRGRVVTRLSGGQANALAIQLDGKIVVAGEAFPFDRFVLARYLPDGRLDPSLGGRGLVVTGFGAFRAAASAVLVQADSKIVVGGFASLDPGRDFALARYLPDGRLDPSFGDAGRVTTDFDFNFDEAAALALQPDGKIIAVGSTGFCDFDCFSDFALARYHPDGSRDDSFGGDGRVTTPFGRFEVDAGAVAIQPDGKIVAAGEAGTTFVMARYQSE